MQKYENQTCIISSFPSLLYASVSIYKHTKNQINLENKNGLGRPEFIQQPSLQI